MYEISGKEYKPETLINECCWAVVLLLLAKGPCTLEFMAVQMPRSNQGNFPKYLLRHGHLQMAHDDMTQ